MIIRTLAALCLAFAAGCVSTGMAPVTTAHSPPARFASIAGPGDSSASSLYVADSANPAVAQVDVLLQNRLRKGIVDTVTKHMQYPDGIFIDPSGTLYVPNDAESGHDTVKVYAHGGHSPVRVYKGIFCAFDVVAASDGTVYVADPCGVNHHGLVHVFAPGGTKQTRALRPGCAPYSVTLDAQNDLYVGCLLPNSYWSQVKRFLPGATKGVDLLPPKTVFFIGGIALDSHGDLLVEDGGRAAIDVFTAENQPPSRVIPTGQTFPYRFALDARESRLYVASPFLPDLRGDRWHAHNGSGPKRPNTVVVLDYTSGRRLFTLRHLVTEWLPTGIATYPPAPFGPPF